LAKYPTRSLLNWFQANRASFTVEVVRMRVFDSIPWRTVVATCVESVRIAPLDNCRSLRQLKRPYQLDLLLSIQSMRWLNWSLSTVDLALRAKLLTRLFPGAVGAGKNSSSRSETGFSRARGTTFPGNAVAPVATPLALYVRDKGSKMTRLW